MLTCPETEERLPDEGAEVAEHLRACLSCRRLAESYREDARRLREGLRGLSDQAGWNPALQARLVDRATKAAGAGLPLRRGRRFFPIAAALAMLAVALAVVLTSGKTPSPFLSHPSKEPLPKPRLLVIHGTGEAGLEIIRTDRVVWGQVLAVDPKAGALSVSSGRNDGAEAGQELRIYRQTPGGYSEIGVMRIARADEALSSGWIVDSKVEPRAGDVAVLGQPLGGQEKRELLDRLLSEAPGDTAQANAYDALIRGAGLERDVEFLARLNDPRAARRLARILGQVSPFSTRGLPPAGPDLAARMHDWWADSKDRVRWDEKEDRYIEIRR
jgi:hypothetical protein